MERGPCYPNGTCNAGLTCASNLCVNLTDASLPDGAVADMRVPPPYPPGPYGSGLGAIMEKFTFQGFRDPKEQCKDHKSKVVDTTALVAISNEDWFQGDPSPGCDKYRKKLLWIGTDAGWNGAGTSMMKSVQSWIDSGTFNKEVGVLFTLMETSTKTPADTDYIKIYMSGLRLNMPMAADPNRVIRKHFSCTSIPMNMLIDLGTMKIVHVNCAYSKSAMEAAIQSALTN
jgi:hypothetical protein